MFAVLSSAAKGGRSGAGWWAADRGGARGDAASLWGGDRVGREKGGQEQEEQEQCREQDQWRDQERWRDQEQWRGQERQWREQDQSV